ncbi:MAG: crossover junction endodeoxyribonuclease RuvC [Armatimonadota bacterium]|nr:crossover junction endodeoxyribonuclease RuvC [Armatimonadota bacterium]MDW8103684.1 crossover junction endodeoxyribonuclease RuvC [Armatimonadota bacterium]MDW8290181.1 crossover junction endodeoxyribonuclease RuvC [Armatimonadota bacterium]
MIIIGFDPGTAITGYGVLQQEGQQLRVQDFGCITTAANLPAPRRIQRIYEEVCRLLDEHQPDVVVTERLFFNRNETTALSVGRTVGVILLAAAQRGIEWVEYTPLEVKTAVVGYGGAEKRQVQYMVTRLLGLADTPKPDDAADALAVALCHAHSAWARGLVTRGR